ncbi:MAG: hypothetical protein AAB390_01960 [Patescibacteria group bacterium]
MMDKPGRDNAENKEKIIRRLAEKTPEEKLRERQAERENRIKKLTGEAALALRLRDKAAEELKKLRSERNPGGIKGLEQTVAERTDNLQAIFDQLISLGVINPLVEARLAMEQKLREVRAMEKNQREQK